MIEALHIDGTPCLRPGCAQTHIPPVVEPDCPRCGKGSLEQMTAMPDRYARCTVYLVCEACGYERPAGWSDGVL